MTREELLKSPEYWLVSMQQQAFAAVNEYLKANPSKTAFCKKAGLKPGEITQILDGDLDCTIEEFCRIMLAAGKVPIIHFVDMDEHIKADGTTHI